MKNAALVGAFLLIAFPAREAFADDPVLLADINKTESLTPNNILSIAAITGAQSGTNFFFTKSTTAAGNELWVTDGSAAGTHLVKDINPGPGDSLPLSFAPARVGGVAKVYFSADDGTHGRELWISDGTDAGTVLVKDIEPGATSSFPFSITTLPNSSTAIFAAQTTASGSELWMSDGTAGSTNQVVDANPGSAGSSPANIFFSGNFVAWSADDGTHGAEPWGFGSGFGPAILSDVNPGSASSNPAEFIANPAADKLLFSATSAADGTEMWVTGFSGITPTTTLLKDIAPGSDSSSPTGLELLDNSTVTFFTSVAGGSFGSYTLWKTDATGGGTTSVKDFGTTLPLSASVAGAAATFARFGIALNPLAVSNGKLYFFATGTDNHLTDLYSAFSDELWVSDGTNDGTTLVSDVFPGPGGSFSGIFPLGNSVVAALNDGTHGFELWSSQGTAATTALISDLNPGIAGSLSGAQVSPFGALGQVVGGSSGLLAQCVIGQQNKIVFTDGTAAHTRVVTDIGDATKNQGSGVTFLGAVGAKELFAADDGVHGSELYVSDGTAAGTALLKDIHPAGAAYPSYLQTFEGGSKALFQAFTPETGPELWVTDGTAAGTALLRDIHVGPVGSMVVPTGAELNGKIFLSVGLGSSSYELWVTDGTPVGTTFVKQVWIDSVVGSSPAVRLGSKVFFSGSVDASGKELWVSDGTAAGTQMVVDLVSGSGNSSPGELTALGNQLIFAATTASGTELWKSDGSAAGTALLKDINPGAAGSNPSKLFALGGLVYFIADDGVNGSELWVTDGTSAGTKLLKDIHPGSAGSAIEGFASAGDNVVFGANDGTHGSELWTSGGTAESTVLLNDINPGAHGSGPVNLFNFPGTNLIFFFATDDVSGPRIWRTDGTADGTTVAGSIYSRSAFAAANGYLYFTADPATTGQEPYSLQIDLCPNDNEKLGPGVCGCGVSDSADANMNDIPDCMSATDLLAQATALKKLVVKLKPAKTKKAAKALKANKKAATAALKALLKFVKDHGSSIIPKGKVSLAKLSAKVKSEVSKALKLQSSLPADVKRAKTALGAMLKALS